MIDEIDYFPKRDKYKNQDSSRLKSNKKADKKGKPDKQNPEESGK